MSLIPTALLITGVAILVRNYEENSAYNILLYRFEPAKNNPVTLLFELQESVGIAKALAAKNGYELDSNQEVCFSKKGKFH